MVGLASLAAFKYMVVTAPNTLVGQFSGTMLLTRFPKSELHWTILKAFAANAFSFGAWLLCPVPLLLLHVLAKVRGVTLAGGAAPWLTTAGVLTGVVAANYTVYLLTPYDLQWHLDSSLSRLLLQVWPAFLVLYSMWVSPRFAVEPHPWTGRMSGLVRAAAGAVVLIVFSVGVYEARAYVNRPKIVLDRREVIAGKNSYTLKIAAFADERVAIRYTINGGPSQTFAASLNTQGTMTFPVSESTLRGVYRFTAFRKFADSEWIPSDVQIVVK
jgi:hypothetical protein